MFTDSDMRVTQRLRMTRSTVIDAPTPVLYEPNLTLRTSQNNYIQHATGLCFTLSIHSRRLTNVHGLSALSKTPLWVTLLLPILPPNQCTLARLDKATRTSLPFSSNTYAAREKENHNQAHRPSAWELLPSDEKNRPGKRRKLRIIQSFSRTRSAQSKRAMFIFRGRSCTGRG